MWSLYKGDAPELNVGKVKVGQVDDQWKRRQHSMIWSPQNAKYDFESGAGGGKGAGGANSVEKFLDIPIEELEEEDEDEVEEEEEEQKEI